MTQLRYRVTAIGGGHRTRDVPGLLSAVGSLFWLRLTNNLMDRNWYSIGEYTLGGKEN